MKEDKEHSRGALAPPASSALMRESGGLVRRGLEDLKLSEGRNEVELDATQRESPKPSESNKRYSIVWQELSVGSEIGQRFWVADESGCLPFFIDGDNPRKLESREAVPLEESMLLRGLLYTWDANPPLLSGLRQEVRLRLLRMLMEGFGFSSLERLVLNVASKVREDHGNWASYKMLKNGASIVPGTKSLKKVDEEAVGLRCVGVALKERLLILSRTNPSRSHE